MMPSPLSVAALVALVAAVAGALVAFGWAAGRARWAAATGAGLVAWLGATALLARSGVLARFDRLPPPGPLLLIGLTAATAALAFSPFGSRLARTVPLAALVGLHAFRLPLELLLHRLHVEGVLPAQMTYAGLNFDVVTGATAVALALWLAWGRAPRGLVVGWNALGSGLLLAVVAVALLSLPTPFRQFEGEPSTAAVLTFPLVWLPTFLVQAAWFGHLLVLRRLRADRHAPGHGVLVPARTARPA